MYPLFSTRMRILVALLILGGKSTYSRLKSFLAPGYGGPKFYGMLRRLEKEGLVRRFHRQSSLPRRQAGIVHRPLIRLMPPGIELLERRYGQRIWRLANKNYKSYKDYNQTTWSLIILNFPTGQAYVRSRLAGRLAELGCGRLRDGVYVSAYPIFDSVAEWAEENNCLERVTLAAISNQQSAISNLLNSWDLPGLFRRYLSLFDRLNIARGISLPGKRERAIRRIKTDFLDLLVRDPLLPKPLLPLDYPLARVIGEITNLDKDISRDEIKIDNLSDKKLVKTGPKNPPPPLKKL